VSKKFAITAIKQPYVSNTCYTFVAIIIAMQYTTGSTSKHRHNGAMLGACLRTFSLYNNRRKLLRLSNSKSKLQLSLLRRNGIALHNTVA
jgi:hypothetical protein